MNANKKEVTACFLYPSNTFSYIWL